MYYLGIDGGGTKTAFCLLDEKGKIRSYHTDSSCYFLTIGLDGIKELFARGIKACIGDIPYSSVTAFAGIPAYGESAELKKAIPLIRESIPFPIEFSNDMVVGHAGALYLVDRIGINVVAGTGSIAYGMDESGSNARSGGWGHLFNCDEGSGHYIGMKLIKAFTRQADGREKKTKLYDAFKEHLKLVEDFDIFEELVTKKNMARKDIAHLAVMLNELISVKDSAALKIAEESSYELMLLAKSIKNTLNFKNEPVWVSGTGGVFDNIKFIWDRFGELVAEEGMKLRKPDFEPVFGACLLARGGKAIDKEFINNLKAGQADRLKLQKGVQN